MSEEAKKKRRGFVIVPRIVRLKYRDLTHAEKWLYVCLCDLCGEGGTCFRSLRTLEEETGIAFGSLSPMIKHLQEAGLIHAEKKRRPGGSREIWHITVIDIWEKNAEYLAKSQDEESEQGTNEEDEHPDTPSTNVQKSHINVGKSHTDVQNSHEDPAQCSEITRQCVKNLPERERMNKTSLLNKTNRMREREPAVSQEENNPSIILSDLEISFDKLYWRQKYTVKPKKRDAKYKEQCSVLAPEITSDEELLSLFEYTRKLIKGENPTVFLGNMVRELPGWIQARGRMQSNPFRIQPPSTEEKPAEFIDKLVQDAAQVLDDAAHVEQRTAELKRLYQCVDEAEFKQAEEDALLEAKAIGDEKLAAEGHKGRLDYYVWFSYMLLGVQRH